MAIGRVLAMALSFISVPIIARTLGTTGRGETAMAIAVFGMIPIVLAFGIHFCVRRQSAIGYEGGVVRASRIFIAWLFIPSVLLGILLHETLFNSLGSTASLWATIIVFLSPLSVSWMCDSSVLVARGNYIGTVVVLLVQPVAYVIGLVILWIVDLASTASVIAVFGIGTTATFVVSTLLVRVTLMGDRLHVGSVLRESSTYAGGTISEAGAKRADQMLMLPLLGASSAGVYSVSAALVTAPIGIGQALAAAYFNRLASTTGLSRSRIAGEAVRSSWVLGIFSGLAVASISPFLIPVLFGEGFEEAVQLTIWMAPVAVLSVVGTMQSALLAAMSRGKSMTVANTLALGIIAIGLIVTTPLWGLTGAVLTLTLSNCVLVTVTSKAIDVNFNQSIPFRVDIINTFNVLTRPFTSRDEDNNDK